MHSISQIHIVNFRACRDVSLSLGDFTPLVGQNNVGKSTILEAIKIVLTPRTFQKTDPSNPDEIISIAACIDGISPEIIALIPEAKHQTAITPYCVDGRLWVRVSSTLGTMKPVQEVWEPAKHAGEGTPTEWRKYPTGLPEAVNALLPEALHVIAMEDVGEDLGKAKAGSTIRGLLDEIMAPILEAHAEVQQALDSVRSLLASNGQQRSPLLRGFDANATIALADFFPGLAIDMDVPSIDIKEFFKVGDLYVTDDVSKDRRRFDQVGSGAQRAIQMALIRYLADIRRGGAEVLARRLLLIDEPELYLHPQGVRRLREALRKLSGAGFQVIFSTHSPLMLSRENAPDTVVVRRDPAAGAVVNVPLREAVLMALNDAKAQSRTLFELGNVAEIYFCDKVVICEGKTDQRLLPLLYERLYGCSAEIDRICFVSLGNCSGIPKSFSVLLAMGIQFCAVVDLDFAFVEARKGADAWLDKDGADLAQAKAVLARLGPAQGLPLGGNGLPINQGQNSAATTWAKFAEDAEGASIAQGCHDALKDQHVWAWPVGCIEDVLGAKDKGEEAILAQEERLRVMAADEIAQEMPSFKACLEWIKQI